MSLRAKRGNPSPIKGEEYQDPGDEDDEDDEDEEDR